MSSFALRLLALFTMGMDHMGLALFPAVPLFRCVGRLSFPLYCFLLTQGFIHTRDLRAYGRRLTLLAFLSEIPFDLLIFGRITSGMEQNVFFSLLLALLALFAAHALRGRPLASALSSVTLCMAAMLSRVSYGWLGIVLCLSFYYAGQRRAVRVLCVVGIEAFYCLTLYASGVDPRWVVTSLCALFSALPIALYNGRRGYVSRVSTCLFYAAYPLHLLFLVLIRALHMIPPYLFI